MSIHVPMRVSASREAVPVNVEGGIKSPPITYSGPYTVSPREDIQVLGTEGRTLGIDITVNAIPNNYVGSAVPRRASSDLTSSGPAVSVPAGFYAANAAKSVTTAVHPDPSVSLDSDTGLVSAVHTQGTGYVTGGTKSASLQLSTQAAATITPTTSPQTAVAAGKFTTGAVTVAAIPGEYIIPSGTKTITANDTGIDVTEYAAVDVAVPGSAPVLQTKSVSYTPTESAQTDTVTADVGYDGLEEVDVTVGAISSTYVGSGVARRDDTDLTASGATVTVPAGYYEDTETKSVDAGAAATPATAITANPTISVNSATGVITATASASQSITPTVTPGYVSGGTAGTVTVGGSATESLTAQPATTYHPSSSDQTIAGGAFLTGAQTINAVTLANLTADNIKNGVTVKVGDSDDDDCVASVTGTYSGGGGASNVVTGTFKGTTTGAAMEVNLPYTGNGFPLSISVFPVEGAYNSSGTFYNTIQRYATVYYNASKNNTESPTYLSADAANEMMVMVYYKSSSSAAATVSATNNTSTEILRTTDASASATGRHAVHFNSKNVMSVFIASNSYGFMANTEYRYVILYSS